MQKFLLLLFCFLSFHAFSQQTYEIGLSFSSGKTDLVSSEDLVGAPGYSGNGFYAIGINYLKPVKSWLELETGLEYSAHKITITPNLPPNEESSVRREKIGLLSIPLACRLKFLKYAFVNGGLLVDFDTSISNSVDNQTGIGVILGTGIKYDFKSGITISANPCLRMHSVLAFSADGHHQRLVDSAVKFGIGYRF